MDKSKKIKVLYKTDWVSLRRMVDTENGISGYDYLHEDRCNGKIVSILPFTYHQLTGERMYLLRKEVTPCWTLIPVISSITGGVENNDPRETAVHEIAEEAGYEIKKEDLILLDTCFGTKSSDTIYYIYTVNLTTKDKTLKADGDGSELEKKAHCFWSTTIENAFDPLVYVAYYRINSKIK